jgi:hypothetical protein
MVDIVMLGEDFFFVLVCAASHHSTGVVAYRHQFHTDMERDGKGWKGLNTDMRGHEVVA